ncbi:lipopolysaccharide biosynthesis protein [Capnocytophaga canimorsus]|uniref:lipopolysaccharide biosynthesis protein n=1 Tax=Capnocytophaga canimorsus TaxID=28188 RepID=UPI0037CE2EEA
MGFVFKQSLKNILTTYLGFAIGAINTLFLFTYFLSKSQYGLVSYITSTATILSPLIAFGVHQTYIRFYATYDNTNERSRFNFMLFLLPWAVIIPLVFVGYLSYEHLVVWLSSKNAEVGNYLPVIFFTGITMAYFEIGYAWARVQLQTVAGNFLKEVFHRVGILLLLVAFYFKLMTFEVLVQGVFWVYFLRMICMFVLVFFMVRPQFHIGFPSNKHSVLWYSAFVVLSGSVATLLVDIDKFMLNQYVALSDIAIYNVAIFSATVVVIPYRAVYQIVSPLVAQWLHQNKINEIHQLYHRSTLGVFAFSMLIFVLIVTNARQMYALLPDPAYEQGLWVLIIIACVKLSDALTGVNNALLFNSAYYRYILLLGILLLITTVLLNIWLIPKYGINGSAVATFIAFIVYNTLKISLVYAKFRLQPFSKTMIQIIFIGAILTLIGYFWDFSFANPLINILLKSILILILTFPLLKKIKSEISHL